jgi:hypothetical protein
MCMHMQPTNWSPTAVDYVRGDVRKKLMIMIRELTQ